MPQTPSISIPELSEQEKPFVVTHERLNRTPSGYHQPGAGVRLTPALRTSGLLMSLPPDDLRTLILMMTFVTANGWIRPSVEQIAQTMDTSPNKAHSRLNRLASFSWHGEPIAYEAQHGGGLITFSPSRSILGSEEPPDMAPTPMPADPARTREAVIAHSRARYTRPRAEVEHDIAVRQGWPLPGEAPTEPGASEKPVLEGPAAELYKRLAGLGVVHDEVDRLFREYDLESIERQLRWLPYRKAKNPARFIIAAIEDDYDEPPALRHRISEAQVERGEAGSADDAESQAEPSGDMR
jgi:hypothetical protein